MREGDDGPTVVPCEAVGTSGLESLSIEALTEIGNKVEDGLRAETIKKLSAVADCRGRGDDASVVQAVDGFERV